MEHVAVAVIGAGPAGLSLSHELTDTRDRARRTGAGPCGADVARSLGQLLPRDPELVDAASGFPYDGPDPDGFMPRDEIVAHFERYAEAFDAPVREGVEVRSIRALDDVFELSTSSGDLRAGAVVIASGAFQRPHRPEVAATLPAGILQIDVEGYRSEEALPAGRVLIVGSGQSGCQIAEELHEAGREVFLACGKAPWVPRRIGGRDFVWWGLETGFLDAGVESLPTPELGSRRTS